MDINLLLYEYIEGNILSIIKKVKKMVFDYDVFCENLKLLRETAGYSKFQMSIQANVHYQYYCNIENGNRIPSFKIVIAIANA